MSKVRPIKIGSRKVGPRFPAYIIFEVASTHANDWKVAKDYVKQAKEAGADALKFQLFTADGILNPLTPGLKGTYDYFKTAQMPRKWFPKLLKLSQKAGIDLLCTPFDEKAATFLNNLGLPAIKIASGDLTNHQLLAHVAKFKKPVILSTGMATMSEIKEAISILKKNGCRELALLQCVSIYPTSFEDANVKAMQTIQDKFIKVIGYSDNGSKGNLVPLMAVALGASIIEKHVTSQKRRGNLDDKFSMTVSEFAKMVKEIRKIEKRPDKDRVLAELKGRYKKDFDKALGDGVKRPAPHGTRIAHPGVKGSFIQKERDERRWARRGIYPSQMIRKGTKIRPEMLISLRPDIGVSALELDSVVGSIASEDLPEKHPIKIAGSKVKLFRKSDIRKTYKAAQDVQFVKTLEVGATFD
jgi:sialic acid synthase SpsE